MAGIQNNINLKKYIMFFFIIVFLLDDNEGNNFFKSSLQPKISIFLPIYNKAKFILRSIESIQIQTLKNIEIIAVNDGSTDNSLKILKKLSKKDLRIKIINNDRNHGLLYSRAMGILNCTGKYIMDLDPDDKLKDKLNLEKLYYKIKKTKSDLIIFLIKRIYSNKEDKLSADLENKFQIQMTDYRITNKLMDREIILKAYKYYSKYIYKNIWNFHEDNIWNLLVRKFSKKTEILNEYIYIYRRNKDSLNMRKGNIIDIKNQIYRLKLFFDFYNMFKRNFYYNHPNIYISNIILLCNASFLNNHNEIKKGITKILINNLNIYKNKVYINNILNIISHSKIILLINSYKKTFINYLDNLFLFKYFQKNSNKRIISMDIVNNNNINNIYKYIYSNDILIGMDNIIYDNNFKNISNLFSNNKMIIYFHNLYNNKKSLINSSNIIFYSFNKIVKKSYKSIILNISKDFLHY